MISVGLLGTTGRMGQAIRQALEGAPFSYGGGASSSTSSSDYEALFSGPADVFIDFSLPEVVKKHVNYAVTFNKPIVIGVTGFEEKDFMLEASKKIPLLYSPNMSMGIAIMEEMVRIGANSLGDLFDVSILDVHHCHKRDSPSGTAKMLQAAAQNAQVASLRVGAVAGEHTVSFWGNGESLHLAHRVEDRKIFAQGALKAAQWLVGKTPGFYSLRHVLGLHAL